MAESDAGTDAGKGPLSGIRVLDLTQFLAGPYSTQILADLGAEVIKLESPAGDWSRTLPPHFVAGESCYFLSINRNKAGVVIDMKQAAGLELAKRLSDSSDILMENFRPGVLDRLGLGYADLSARNPGLIWCAISGFGQHGPYRDRPAYDMIVQAISGGMSLTGEPGRAAVRAGIPIGDLAAGMYGVIGVLAALEERHRTGRGRVVDISMLDCQVAMLSYQAAYYLHSGQEKADIKTAEKRALSHTLLVFRQLYGQKDNSSRRFLFHLVSYQKCPHNRFGDTLGHIKEASHALHRQANRGLEA